MKLSKLKILFQNELKSVYSKQEIDVIFFKLLEKYLNLSKINYFLDTEKEISILQYDIFINTIKELQQNKPIQYILSEAHFYGLSFYVDENVLIPRQETEELVDWIIRSTNKEKCTKILDIGTGSGCIAVSLAKNLPNAQVFALDISNKALQIAKKNAEKNSISVTFINEDIMKIEKLPYIFDIIVSNPPYVRESEKKQIAKNVLEYEPHLALFVPDENPLIFYNKIADFAKNNLSENGFLFFEINQYLANEMSELLSYKNYKNIELKKDLNTNHRMIRATFL